MLDKMIVFNTNTNPSQASYDNLSKENKALVDRFEANCNITANPKRAYKAKANAIRFILMVGKPIKEIKLQDLKDFLLKLKEAKFSDYYTNDVKNFVSRFIKDQFPDWSARFNNLEDIKYDSEPIRKKKIENEDVLSKEDVEKLGKAEKDIFWKTFLMLQYEGAQRTGETRATSWDSIDTKEGDTYWLTITSKKNRKGKDKERIVPLQQSIFYLEELRKIQKEQGIKSKYVFPSKKNPAIPISSGTANLWFRRLVLKVLGKHSTNYILRHSKGEEYHIRVRDNQMSKENATRVMGHSEKMFDRIYSHADKKLLKEQLKKQILNIEYVEPEKKAELEKEIEKLSNEIKIMKLSWKIDLDKRMEKLQEEMLQNQNNFQKQADKKWKKK